MTIQANILPAEHRRRYRQLRRFRWWAAATVAVGIAHLTIGTALAYMAGETRRARAETVALMGRHALRFDELALLTKDEEKLSGRLQLSENLRRKHRWSELVTALVVRLPETVLLTKLETDPPKGEPPAARTATHQKMPKKAETVVEQPDRSAKGLIMTGVGVDHESIATFLRAINADPDFGHCQLQSTARQAFREGEGVAFTAYIGW
jgi:Tfp pilus assembly protein PilN